MLSTLLYHLSHTVAMRGSRAGRVQNPTLLFLSSLENSNLLNSHSNFNENRHRTPPTPTPLQTLWTPLEYSESAHV